MYAQKVSIYFILMLTFVLLFTGCGQKTGVESPATTATSLPAQASTVTPASSGFGIIKGHVHGQSPPTPPMMVYALDNETGAWYFAETPQADGEAPFALQVAAGSYQVFAFSETGPFAGHSSDGWTLSMVAVAAGQTVSDIVVRPPGQSECGAMFGLPASPDGRFAAIEGPSLACQEAAQAASLRPVQNDSQPTPVEVPPGFEMLFALGEPLMLPPAFPVDVDLPSIQPYVVTAEPGEYEISLDYGADCQGAGACHYGSLAGKRSDSTGPVGTRNHPFEAERAQPFTLAQGIQGYFIESVCEANCSDALTFWIYDGYQYMLGVRAGHQVDVLNLVNAAIENSLPPVGAPTGAPTGSFQPLDAVACGSLSDALASALGVPTAIVFAPFEDRVSGQMGDGCQIAASGNGLNFENIIVVENGMVGVLQAQGWTEDSRYMGGGPGAFLTGYRKASALCLAMAYWEPSEDADCPQDQPIGTCELPPEQQAYTITLDCARQQ